MMDASRVSLRLATPEDQAFAWQVHNATIKEMVTQIWGWDEDWQRGVFTSHYNSAPPQIIVCDGQDVGVWAVHPEPEYVHVDTLLILPVWQRRGIGSYLLRRELAAASAHGRTVRLQTFLINLPARAFYDHLGFTPIGQTETHLLLEARSPLSGERPAEASSMPA